MHAHTHSQKEARDVITRIQYKNQYQFMHAHTHLQYNQKEARDVITFIQ